MEARLINQAQMGANSNPAKAEILAEDRITNTSWLGGFPLHPVRRGR
jgi:hypothetical protein